MYIAPFASSSAQAVDIKMSGMFDFAGVWGATSFQKDSHNSGKGQGRNTFFQRLRTQIDIIASESLTGVVMFEIGDTTWGKAGNGVTGAGRSTGGAIATDGVSIEVKRAYLDWIVPQTDLKVRVGLQGFSNPSFTGGQQVINDAYEMGGISANYQFNPTVGLTAWWFRPYADNVSNGRYQNQYGTFTDRPWDDMDMFGFSVPLAFDGVKVTPWAMYATIGRDSLRDDPAFGLASGVVTGANTALLPYWTTGSQAGWSSKGQGSGYWLGLTGEVTLWNPFRFAWDFNYGATDMGHIYRSDIPGMVDGNNVYLNQRNSAEGYSKYDLSRSGWIISAIAEYKLDMMTPGLFFWYGTGDDGNAKNGSEMMPSIAPSAKYTSFGQDGAMMNMPGMAMEGTLAGSWGIGAQLKDIRFVQDLKHTFRVTYYRGTNDKKMAANWTNDDPALWTGYIAAPWSKKAVGLYMTDKDSAWEFNLENTYDIYKNLQLGVDLGYIKLNLSENAWGKTITNKQEDAYKIAVGLRYTF